MLELSGEIALAIAASARDLAGRPNRFMEIDFAGLPSRRDHQKPDKRHCRFGGRR
ncbi:hypothetical protein P3W43_04505 [Salinicola salarius]|uniref:hypothetical protein n=1 Tax=Salinicola salarius TaxID=430457 RepID=UPI0023E443EE|nr:hypothetical protein [Salinicola salarius]MDF3918119.1 hypothetical protein [Salinicola salarius]